MLVKTHLIVTDQYDEYEVNWVKRLVDSKPKLDEHGFPTFSVVTNKGRIDIKTFDINYLEKRAKAYTFPKGRGAVTSDKGYIYIKEEEGEVLLAVVSHTHIRKYAPMYDDI